MFESWNGRAAMAALTTPYAADGSIDRPAFAAHAQALLRRGLDGVVPFGTTGEGASLGLAEKRAALEHLVRAGIATDRIVAGVACAALPDALEAVRHALALGCRGVLVAPPFYFKGPDDEGLYAWYAQIIEGAGAAARGVVLYHIPSVTAVPLSPGLVNRLRAAFGAAIGAVKDSSGDLATARAFLKQTQVPLLIGSEDLLGGLLGEGALGSISGLANIVPERLAALIHRAGSDGLLPPAVRALMTYPVIPAIKALHAHVAREPRWAHTRPPLAPLGAREQQALGREWDALLARHAA